MSLWLSSVVPVVLVLLLLLLFLLYVFCLSKIILSFLWHCKENASLTSFRLTLPKSVVYFVEAIKIFHPGLGLQIKHNKISKRHRFLKNKN